jgi:hypothetical protein
MKKEEEKKRKEKRLKDFMYSTDKTTKNSSASVDVLGLTHDAVFQTRAIHQHYARIGQGRHVSHCTASLY